jgi:hypothetical protein
MATESQWSAATLSAIPERLLLDDDDGPRLSSMVTAKSPEMGAAQDPITAPANDMVDRLFIDQASQPLEGAD